jgi:hypothetical protein
MDTTEAIIKQASARSKTLRITGYHSTDGKISDFVVLMIGPEGYRQKVAASLDFIRKNPGKTSVEVDAINELDTSWSKTLAGAHSSRSFSDDLIPVGDFFKSAADPTKIILRHLHKIEEHVIYDPPPPPPNSRTRGSSEKTLAKRKIESQTPLATYIGQLNLVPGKFKGIEAL